MVGNAEVIPVVLQRPLAAKTDFWRVGRALQAKQLNRLWGCRGTDRCFRKIKSFEEDNFLRFAGFRVYKCPVFGARETGTTFRRLRIEEIEAVNCTNRLRRWDEQQPKHLSDIRRVGRLTGHGVVLLAAWSASAVVNQHGDLASHSAICRTELSYPRNLGKHNRARILFVLP
jgi:hypothetical protein